MFRSHWRTEHFADSSWKARGVGGRASTRIGWSGYEARQRGGKRGVSRDDGTKPYEGTEGALGRRVERRDADARPSIHGSFQWAPRSIQEIPWAPLHKLGGGPLLCARKIVVSCDAYIVGGTHAPSNPTLYSRDRPSFCDIAKVEPPRSSVASSLPSNSYTQIKRRTPK